MAGSFGRSWELMKLSFGVIRKDKEILLFPLISGIVMVTIMLSFILGIFFTGLFVTSSVLMIVFFFLLYVILYFVGIYFNTAVIGCAMIRLQGGDPTLKDGFRIANENIKSIFAWAIVAATVGLILRALSEKMDVLGKIIMSIIGFAWTMATFFVIPVMIYEKLSVGKAIKRSAYVFKDTWGETFISQFGFGLIFFLLGILGIIPIALGFMAGGIFMWVGLIVAFAYFIVLFCLSTAAQGVLVAALYRYATTGQLNVVPQHLLGVEQKGASPAYPPPPSTYPTQPGYQQPPTPVHHVAPVGYIKCESCDTINPEKESQCRTCGQYLK